LFSLVRCPSIASFQAVLTVISESLPFPLITMGLQPQVMSDAFSPWAFF
jgi:hypothetical protein